VTTFVLEIIDIYYDSIAETTATLVFEAMMFSFLIYYSWSLFFYFVRKKKQRNEFKKQVAELIEERKSESEGANKIAKYKKGFRKSTKIAIGWVFIVLFINTVNHLCDLIIHIMIYDLIASPETKCFYEFYTFFCVFWTDILTFTNGIGFLILFKAIA
jgi:hypothetical protein